MSTDIGKRQIIDLQDINSALLFILDNAHLFYFTCYICPWALLWPSFQEFEPSWTWKHFCTPERSFPYITNKQIMCLREMNQKPKCASDPSKQTKQPGNSFTVGCDKFSENSTKQSPSFFVLSRLNIQYIWGWHYVDFLSPHLKVNCLLTQGYFLFSVLVNFLHSKHLKAQQTYIQINIFTCSYE
jgi:hypothetical protein